jgi:hypothetical protein
MKYATVVGATRSLLKAARILPCPLLETQIGDGYERLSNVSLDCSNSDHNVRGADLRRQHGSNELAIGMAGRERSPTDSRRRPDPAAVSLRRGEVQQPISAAISPATREIQM